MRRFSQRNSLVTLNEINITPLLDLAFVLLIIFIITRPLLEQSMNLNLPDVGKMPANETIDPRNVWTVEVNQNGEMRLRGQKMNLMAVEKTLREGYTNNKKLIVKIRGDKITAWDNVGKVIGVCMRIGIKNVAPQVAPE